MEKANLDGAAENIALGSVDGTISHSSAATPAGGTALAEDLFDLTLLHRPLSNARISPRASNVSVESAMRPPLDYVGRSGGGGIVARGAKIEYGNKSDDKKRAKLSFFSSAFFWLGNPWRRGSVADEESKKTRAAKQRAFDLSCLWKKCTRKLESVFKLPSLQEQQRRGLGGRPLSFSGHSNLRERESSWKRRAQLSAPASRRTSPANSGHLTLKSINLSSLQESSMEELQNAIQSAIAHCKNSLVTK